jgi:hypothetical protein
VSFQSFNKSEADLEELKKDLAVLRLNVEGLSAAVSKLTLVLGPSVRISDAIDTATDVAARARAIISERLSHGDADVREYLADIRSYVQRNPLTAAAIFILVGYLSAKVRRF